MKKYYFNYIKNFRCSAGECRHSCCEKWEIDIDKKALNKYKKYNGKLKADFITDIDYSAEKFKTNNGKCAFLCDDGLCKIIKEAGESYLCKVCAFHPRMENRYKRFSEIYLSVSCEEAAKLILDSPDVFIEKSGKISDKLFFRPTKKERLFLINREALIGEIKNSDFISAVKNTERFIGIGEIDPEDFIFPLKNIEYLDDEWLKIINAAEEYYKSGSSFPAPESIEVIKACDSNLRALLIYFLYGYASGEKDEFGFKIRVILSVIITELILAAFLRKGKLGGFSFALFADIAREASREIEFSDENLNALYDFSEEYYFKKIIKR